MVKYWLTLTDKNNWEIIKENNIYAVKSKKILDILSVGDVIVMYLIPKRIVGIFQIENLKSNKRVKTISKGYSYIFDIKPSIILSEPFIVIQKGKRDFINKISIFKNISRWGTILMGRSVIRITREDYVYIKRTLEEVR